MHSLLGSTLLTQVNQTPAATDQKLALPPTSQLDDPGDDPTAFHAVFEQELASSEEQIKAVLPDETAQIGKTAEDLAELDERGQLGTNGESPEGDLEADPTLSEIAKSLTAKNAQGAIAAQSATPQDSSPKTPPALSGPTQNQITNAAEAPITVQTSKSAQTEVEKGSSAQTLHSEPSRGSTTAKTDVSQVERVLQTTIPYKPVDAKEPPILPAPNLGTQSKPLQSGAGKSAPETLLTTDIQGRPQGPADTLSKTAQPLNAFTITQSTSSTRRQSTQDPHAPLGVDDLPTDSASKLTKPTAPTPIQPVLSAQVTMQSQKDLKSLSASSLEIEPQNPLRADATSTSSSTQTTQAITTRMDLPQHVARQIADVLQHMPSRPVEIRLSPEELGRVRLALSHSEAGITVNVLAERPETIDLMRRHISNLEAAFHDIGYSDISFSFAGGETTEDSESNSNKNQSDTNTPAETITPESAEITLSSGVTTGVDIRV